VRVNEFTVHLQFGASLPDGTIVPVGHLAMSRAFALAFCRQLCELLDTPREEAERPPTSRAAPSLAVHSAPSSS
jgi:hypothetical protein